MNSYDSATCDSCLDLCSLSAWLRSPGSHKEQVNYIKTVLDSTQNNNTAVTSETCSHWPSNIQKLNLTDTGKYNSRGNKSGQAGPHDNYMTVCPQSSFAKELALIRMTRRQGLRHFSTPRNVQNVQWISGLDDFNNSRGVFKDWAIPNIEKKKNHIHKHAGRQSSIGRVGEKAHLYLGSLSKHSSKIQ